MNAQLRLFLDLLNDNDIKYWVDSGTLLGLIREGNILINEKDIDIGIHVNQLKKIQSIESKIIILGYKLRYELYNNQISKYKLYPKNKSESLLIDINIYQQHDTEFLWCPLTFFITPKNIFFKSYQKILKFFWRRIFKKIEINRFPFNKIKESYTWIIPYKYYQELIFNNQLECYMFKNQDGYLTYRYNTWESYNKDWKTFRDDGGIIKMSPEKLLS